MTAAQAKVEGVWCYLSGSYEIRNRIKELPEARWSGTSKQWRVLASPMAMAALESYGVELDEKGKALADQYRSSLVPKEFGDEYVFAKTEPWAHQKAGADWLRGRYAGMLAYGMGSGKSLTTIGTISAWKARTVLVICPRSVIGVWRREFHRHCASSYRMETLERGSTSAKANQVHSARFHWQMCGEEELFVVVVNYETAWRTPLDKMLLGFDWDAVILDESHRVKSHDGRASKFSTAVGRAAKHRLCLTGTPMPHSPLDIYAQMRFIEPGVFGTSFARFRARFAHCDPHYPSRVLRWKNQDELASLIDPWIRRVETADVVDLPPITHQRIEFELNPKSRTVYRELETEMVTYLESGEEITAPNTLVKLLRLQQITSGHCDGTKLGEDKLLAFLDIAADIPADNPIVVFCRFSDDIRQIREAAKKLGRSYGEISGSRKDLTEHSTMPKGIQLMAVQQQSGGVGIDLTEAAVGFWYSLSYSLGDYEQANARMHRPGQQKHVSMFHLVASGTVDETIYEALEARRDVVDEVLSQLVSSKGNNNG